MMEKMKDEYEAMMICREKVVQRGLPMQIVDAEYQWSVAWFLTNQVLIIADGERQGSKEVDILFQGGQEGGL